MAGRTSSPSSADASEESTPVEVKKESPEDEIKEYAETAMNELLGWYGYEKLDSRDTQDLDLHHFASKHSRRHLPGRLSGRLLGHHPASIPPLRPPPPHRPAAHRPTRHTVRTTMTKLPAPAPPLPAPPLPPPQPPPEQPDAPTPCESSPPTLKLKRETSESPPETTAAAASGTSVALEESSAEAKSSSSASPQSPASLPPTAAEALLCSWCGRAAGSLPITAPSTTTTLSVRNGGSSSVTSTTTKAFCSEVCFTQCRRASFKRSKACDWCRHVRHTVAYVDFQDGETQLQFCSDKCLNQYKMNIFCKETQAHLAQLKAEASGATPSATVGAGPPLIITPDLWLRDCREGEDGGREEGDGESHEEEEDEDEEEPPPEEVEEDPETSPLRQQQRTHSTEGPSLKPPEKKSKEHRRKKRRRSEEAPPLIPLLGSSPSTSGPPSSGPFQQVRPAAFLRMQGPRKTPSLPHRTPPGFVPPPPIPPPPFLPPHFPPHVPLHLLPPEAHFHRFLHPRAESLPHHVMPNGPSSLQHPPPPPRVPPTPLPQPPSLLPPVTMLVPYPIILPIPVPIPIPIPILGDVLLKRLSREEGATKEETEGRLQRPPPAPSSPHSPPPSPQYPTPEMSTRRDRSGHRKRPRGSSPEEDSPVVGTGTKRKFVPA